MEGHAEQVHRGAEQHLYAAGFRFAGDGAGLLVHEVRVEGGCGRNRVRERGCRVAE
ncbi:hypothetical protein LT974_07655 [Halobacterium noricense]|nr:hypothetical protein [Halobacterium noricense]UHH26796.1 hypothetical protein LT974_07655 [Halobacterium noricense]